MTSTIAKYDIKALDYFLNAFALGLHVKIRVKIFNILLTVTRSITVIEQKIELKAKNGRGQDYIVSFSVSLHFTDYFKRKKKSTLCQINKTTLYLFNI